MANIEKEIWKPIKGYEGLYEITSSGRIRSLDRMCLGVDGVNKLLKGKEKKISIHKQGHHVVRLWKNNKSKLYNLYRLLAINFISNPDCKPEVNHIDGNRANYRIDNLEWVTASENMRHAFNHGLAKGFFKSGFDHSFCKMGEKDVILLIQMRDNGAKFKDLAIHFKITHEHAGRLYKKYKNVLSR